MLKLFKAISCEFIGKLRVAYSRWDVKRPKARGPRSKLEWIFRVNVKRVCLNELIPKKFSAEQKRAIIFLNHMTYLNSFENGSFTIYVYNLRWVGGWLNVNECR